MIKYILWLHYSDENNHFEAIPVMRSISHLFCVACKLIESDKLHLLLILSSETATGLIVCTEEQMCKLSTNFNRKTCLHFKDIHIL